MSLLLSQIEIKEKARITSISGGVCGEKLRHLGLHEGLQISLLSKGDPAIIYCHRSRLAICHQLLDCITVELIPGKQTTNSIHKMLRREENPSHSSGNGNNHQQSWLHRKCRRLLSSMTIKPL